VRTGVINAVGTAPQPWRSWLPGRVADGCQHSMEGSVAGRYAGRDDESAM